MTTDLKPNLEPESNNLLFKIFEKVNEALEAQKSSQKLPSRAFFFRVFRLFFAITILAIGFKLLMDKNSKVDSLQGFVNGEIVTVNSPIRGVVSLKSEITPGHSLKAGEKIGSVEALTEEHLSDLEITKQSIASRIQASQEHLNNLNALITDRKRILADFASKASLQKNLRLKYERDRLSQYESELEEAVKVSQLNKKESARLNILLPEGYVSKSDAEEAESKAGQAEAKVMSKKALIKQAKAQMAAASSNLQVEGSQTESYPEIRRKELEAEILQIQQNASEAKLQIALNQAELEKVNMQIMAESKASLISPVDGVIWSIVTYSKEHIKAGEEIVKVLNCRKRWIEAFVAEKDFSGLYIGAPVTVKSLNADSKVWEGTIKAIRSGTSRVKVGQDVDILPPELVRRQVALRIEVDWKEENDLKVSPREFCEVGSSIEVRFKRQKANNK